MMSWLPENISADGVHLDFLFYAIYYITGIIFILVAGCMIAFLILYRQKPGVRATYTHGHSTLEIVWTVTPAIILVIILFLSHASWAKMKLNPPKNPDVRLEVIAKQINWIVVYPGPDGKFGTKDDVKLDNQVNIPINKTVYISLTGEDVIHSFFIPHARVKQDVVPGRQMAVWFKPIKTGKFEIPCAELCGTGHSGMKGELIVHSAASYQAFLTKLYAKKSS